MILHSIIEGEGEPAVFLHAGLQTGEQDFVEQRQSLKSIMCVIALDLRGHGKSKSDDLGHYFEACAEDIKHTLNHLNLKRVHLIGASMGALTAVVFAKQYPQYVATLTVSGIMAEKPDHWLEIHEKEAAFQRQLRENKDVEKHFTDLHGPGWEKLLDLAQDENWYPFSYTKDLDGGSFPVLCIAGEENEHETAGVLKYKRNHKHVHGAVVPFASHLVHQQKPEDFNRFLHQFLESYPL
ncbi:alpha/beta hydrolase [Halobacillus kuroshimensis]|uniref:Alpha/beta hydrolase n=1 Tax=Halobacillus kuroshimensis TaxID=302481 RepID=A0ABS3DS04_9BACI|nr:alpha/beta hydrolase [Halobacillus kuroshimensis]